MQSTRMLEDLKRKLGNLLVSNTALSCIANSLMDEVTHSDNSKDRMQALRSAAIMKLKNTTIEGIDYDQQAVLVARALETVDIYFDNQMAKRR